MNNPNGPYPGRQLFLGLTTGGKPCFAYLVTGRSPQSRERKGTPIENTVIMGPIGNQPYDWLRHYSAVKTDNETGLVVVSNGIQTESIFETYRLLFHTGAPPGKGYMKKIMDGARAEPDSLHTPRIACVITNPTGKTEPVYIISIKARGRPAGVFQPSPVPGILRCVSTYRGDMDNPAPFDIEGGLPEVKFDAGTPQELAEFIYGISSATHQGDDIRVCAIGGIRSDDNRTWDLAIINRHQD